MASSSSILAEHTMNVALIGATGFIGGALLEEAVRRGHCVTAIARDPSKLAPCDGIVARRVDVADTATLADALR